MKLCPKVLYGPNVVSSVLYSMSKNPPHVALVNRSWQSPKDGCRTMIYEINCSFSPGRGVLAQNLNTP